MRPGSARRRSRRSTGCRGRPSGSRCGRRGRRACWRVCAAISARPRRPRARSRTSRRASSSGRRPRRPRLRGRRPLPAGAAAERARAAQERLASLERAAAARAEERLEALRRERQALEAELADAAGGREGATAALYRLGTARERIAMRAESVSALRESVRVELAESDAVAETARPVAGRARGGGERARRPRPAPLRTRATTSPSARRSRRSGSRRSSARSPSARAFRLPRGCSPNEGAELALSLLDVAPGAERAVAAALGWGASAVVADDAAAGLALLQRARDAGLGSLAVLVGKRPAERVAELPVVPLGELLSGDGPVGDRRGIRVRPAPRRALVRGRGRRGRPARAGDAAASARRRGGGAAGAVGSRRDRGRAGCRSAPSRRRRRTRRSRISAARALPTRRCCAAARSGADRLDEALLAAVAVAARLEQPLRARADAGAERAGELGDRACARRRPRARGARGRRRRRTSAPALRS